MQTDSSHRLLADAGMLSASLSSSSDELMPEAKGRGQESQEAFQGMGDRFRGARRLLAGLNPS